MKKTNATNERIKRVYYHFLIEAHGRDETTVDRVAKSIDRFEETTGRRDFRRFHREQAVAFKNKLNRARSARTGDRLSKATILATLSDLRAFFLWLAREPGFKSHIAYADADYFNLPDKDVAVARAPREKRVPTIDQARGALRAMPAESLIQRRDRAVFAFAMLTGARVSALASFRLKHVDHVAGFVNQDPRDVRTKASKSIITYFMPVDDEARSIVSEWIEELVTSHDWRPDDPLFPATQMGLDDQGAFEVAGLARRCWAGSQPIRDIFSRAFCAARLPYFNPHSFRDMLVHHAMSLGLGPEEMKAWSQNLGHADVLTTFTSYGAIPTHRQGELIQASHASDRASLPEMEQVAALESLLASMKANLLRSIEAEAASAEPAKEVRLNVPQLPH